MTTDGWDFQIFTDVPETADIAEFYVSLFGFGGTCAASEYYWLVNNIDGNCTIIEEGEWDYGSAHSNLSGY